ncbi:MAG: 50S ribosomal protein L24 [Candidatus Margulisiibacteriota bacterium]
MKNAKLKIKKGDEVLILTGKDQGKKGKVLRVIPDKRMVMVEGANMAKKHQRANQKFQGGIIDKPMPVSISKVQLICPRCNAAVRAGRAEGRRICKKCKESIDKE